MRPAFDPRPWNLFAGLTLAASGCGSHLIGVGEDETGDSGNGSEEESGITTLDTSDTNESSTTTGPECVSDSDCSYGYYCYDGSCEYAPHHDGHLDWYEYYECYVDEECGSLNLCYFNYCEFVGTPPECEGPAPVQQPPLPIPDLALALSFADVDDDGADELVVATTAQLHVFESGSDVPTSSLREFDSPSIDAMVAGHFDGQPGEDVAILTEDQLLVHPSDGVGNFGSPTPTASPLTGATGLISGDFDAQAPTDLLLWGLGGAMVDQGALLELSNQPVMNAGARWQSSPSPGFALLQDATVRFMGLDGADLGLAAPRGSSPYTHTPLLSPPYGQLDVTSSLFFAWTLLEAWDPLTGNKQVQWGIDGEVTLAGSGDFDGDGFEELALAVNGEVWIHRNALDAGECLLRLAADLELPIEFAIGDHDGDGDDELAVRRQDLSVLRVEIDG